MLQREYSEPSLSKYRRSFRRIDATFKPASKEIQGLHETTHSSQVQDHLATHRIQWKFIAQYAASWGGWWERMVGSVKTVLLKVLGRTSLMKDELVTLLVEVEAVINSRPITYEYSSNVNDRVLTPAHFNRETFECSSTFSSIHSPCLQPNWS